MNQCILSVDVELYERLTNTYDWLMAKNMIKEEI